MDYSPRHDSINLIKARRRFLSMKLNTQFLFAALAAVSLMAPACGGDAAKKTEEKKTEVKTETKTETKTEVKAPAPEEKKADAPPADAKADPAAPAPAGEAK